MDVPGSIWLRPERPARGPSPTYSREQITTAAVKIADEAGIAAVSMRRVAQELGAGAMSLYRYVGSKDDLIALMLDQVEGEDPLPEAPTEDWRTELNRLAERARAIMLRHPWSAMMIIGRPNFGPNTLRSTEYALACVDGLGLSIDEMLNTVYALVGFVRLFVQNEVAEAEETRRTGMTELQWRATQQPYIQQIIASGRYPRFVRVITDATIPHLDPDQRFRDGVAHMVAGIAAQLHRKESTRNSNG